VTATATGAKAFPDVTVCIPAWQAAGFIDRTLRCARAQTHAAQRIAVSVDLSTDETEEICRSHAREDGRVVIYAQRERLGWTGNVNFLLERVRTEFACLYFHDDWIDSTYTERLVAVLRERPDAASAHCDVGHFGGTAHTLLGRAYEGTPHERLLTLFVATPKGSMLRSMFRPALVGDVRLPSGPGAGVGAGRPFLMKLVAAGPVLRVADKLYWRWGRRPGGLTEGWRSLPLEDILEGYRRAAEVARDIIDGLETSSEERETLMFGLLVYMTLWLRHTEVRYGATSVNPPECLLPEFSDTTIPLAVRGLPEPLRSWCEEEHDRMDRQTGKRALLLGDHWQAIAASPDADRE